MCFEGSAALTLALLRALGERGAAEPLLGHRRSVSFDGFSLHAAVHIGKHDRAGLERLCRYGARPAFASERVALTSNGQVFYRLKRPWPDGRTHLVLSPVAFVRRLAGILPPPGRHLVRYAGCRPAGQAARPRRGPGPRRARPGCAHRRPSDHLTCIVCCARADPATALDPTAVG